MMKRLSFVRLLTTLAPATLLVSLSPTSANVAAPQYAAGIQVDPDFGYVDDGSALRAGYPLFGDSPLVSPNPVDLTLQHISKLRSASTASVYAGPELGGTVRAIASSGDEVISARAGLNYTFQLQPKAGVVVPDVIPLAVFASGSTGTDNYGSASITFILSWFDSLTTYTNIFENTGVSSSPAGIVTFGGDGNIHVDQTINVALNRDISVQMSARASAGLLNSDLNPNLDEYGTGVAYLDPTFTLPEAFRDLVDIVGVPGDVAVPPTDPSTVPEPASWVMMIAGFGAVGAGMRRRKSRSTGSVGSIRV